MKIRIIISLIFCLYNLHLFGQDKIKDLTFVLLIDGEVPIETISDGYFIIKDSSGTIIDKIAFRYKIGKLEFSSIDFNKMVSRSSNTRLSMEFMEIESKSPFRKKIYQSGIWLNSDYLIMNIYNKNKMENAKKYVFGNKEYIVRIESSTFSTIQNYRSNWLRKHKTELD